MAPRNPKIEIRRRRELQNVPSDIREGDEWWFVEAFLVDGPDRRIGFATIKKRTDNALGTIDMVETQQMYRRRGIGTRLVRAAIQTWPYLVVSPGFTPEGQAFLAALRKSGEIDEPG